MNQKQRTLSSVQARKFLPTLLDEAYYQKKCVIVTKSNKALAAIVPLDFLEDFKTPEDKESNQE